MSLSVVVTQAVNEAEEKAQALADACCDLVVTACQLLQVQCSPCSSAAKCPASSPSHPHSQVSNCLALEQPLDSPRRREARLHEVEQTGCVRADSRIDCY